MSYRVIPVTKQTEARTMREAGWSYRAIARTLGVSANTVQVWLDPGYAARQAKKTRIGHARHGLAKPRTRPSTEYLLIRARQLRAAGMTYESLAVLFRVDYGEDVNGDHIRRWIRTGRWRPGKGRVPRRPTVAA